MVTQQNDFAKVKRIVSVLIDEVQELDSLAEVV
jgi:hypothetical protein